MLKNITSQDIQRYVRIALQWVAGYLTTKGMIDQNASWVTPLIGILVGAATLGWTVYGMRIQAKLNEFIALGQNPALDKDAKIQMTNVVAALPETQHVTSTLGNDPATAPNVVVPAK